MPTRESLPHVLVVDDQIDMAEMVADGLDPKLVRATAVGSGKTALERLRTERVDVIVTDLRMPDVDGLALLAASQRQDPQRPVIVMTAYGAIDTAIESIRRGAFHYVTKPFKADELALFVARAIEQTALRREAAQLRKIVSEQGGSAAFVTQSRAMRDVIEVGRRVAASKTPVLILGETGTGKSRLARDLHAMSPRASGPFVSINCAAIPEALLESELFGHVKGAFTGATQAREGLFAAAHGGTLFLDEIGELALSLQGKLLHVIESSTVRMVGSTKEQTVDVRLIAATHRALREQVRAGAFREDLLYRLDVVSLELPPLRHRRDDLPALIEQLLADARQRHPQATVKRISPKALKRMLDHSWPGNVRELAHVLERGVLLGVGEAIEESDLPASILSPPTRDALRFDGDVVSLREMNRRYAAWALDQTGGQRMRTAERLGVEPKTLAKLLSERVEPSAE
jgi:two-component system response regulator HydG